MNMFSSAWAVKPKTVSCKRCSQVFAKDSEEHHIESTGYCTTCQQILSVPNEETYVDTEATTIVEKIEKITFKDDPEYLEFMEWKKNKASSVSLGTNTEASSVSPTTLEPIKDFIEVTPEKVLEAFISSEDTIPMNEFNKDIHKTAEKNTTPVKVSRFIPPKVCPLCENKILEPGQELCYECQPASELPIVLPEATQEDVEAYLRSIPDATTEHALTYNMPRNESTEEHDIISAHIFGGPYDLWVKDYNPTERMFFGFASFGGIEDYNAEWGYVSLDELLSQSPKLERDLYWKPISFSALQDKTIKEIEKTNDFTELAPKPSQSKGQSIEPISAPTSSIPTYQKYQVKERSSNLKDRLYGNTMKSEDLTELYNSFSGNGKLHDLEFKNFDNFHDYTKAKQEFEMGQFYTPDWLCQSVVQLCSPSIHTNILDAACGMGRFFNYIEDESRIYAMDIDENALDVAKTLFPKIHSEFNSILYPFNRIHKSIDYCIGNPPFNLVFKHQYGKVLVTDGDEEDGGKGNLLSQNAYLIGTNYHLREGGVSVFIVPATWLTTSRDAKAKQYINDYFHFIAEIYLSTDTFSEYQIKFPTKVLVMIKKREWVEYPYSTISTTFEDFPNTKEGQWFYEQKKYIDTFLIKNKHEQLKNNAVVTDAEFYKFDKIRKAIYQYSICKNFKQEKMELFRVRYESMLKGYDNRNDAVNSLGKFINEIKRATVKREAKPLSVRFHLDNNKLNITRSSPAISELFNTDEDFKKDFSQKTALSFVPSMYYKNDIIVSPSVYGMVQNVIRFFKETPLSIMYKGELTPIKIEFEIDILKYFDKKIREYKRNTAPTDTLKDLYPTEYEENYEMLSELEIKGGDIKLLPHQKEDLSALLMKPYGLISWDTGLGKSLGGMTYAICKGGRTLIVAPSSNMIDPWVQQLAEYYPSKTVYLCKTAKSIFKYSGEDFLIVSFESLPKTKKEIRKWKFKNLIMDESDSAKSKGSERSKALRAVAKKIKNKILMSGTPTRNNVVEIYNQVEILCNNSVNMLCTAEESVEYDRSSREYITENNQYYMKPFPAWGGHKAFERTFSPKKLTCFGAAETNQDIYNKEHFDNLIRSIRFTRVFDIEKPRINAQLGMEDNGIYKEFKQVIVPMSEGETKLYEYILTEFAQEMENYYRSKHDGATASKLVIMQQIMNLLQGTSHPWTYEQYVGEEISSKLIKAKEIVDQAMTDGKKVMIASPWVATADKMAEMFPDYQVFRLTSEMSKHKRAEIVTRFRNWPGSAIITGTMGCLKSGLNLPEVSVVIAESYPWNYAQLYQYVARAIRLNSTTKTDIYCLCSEGSFDLNVFSLILRKEVMNTFVRTSEEITMTDLTKDFGTDVDIFAQAMQMVSEKTNGKTRGTIKWSQSAKME